MNRMPVLVVGIFLTFLSSWLGLVAYPYFALARYTPVTDEETGDILPPPLSGLAERGQLQADLPGGRVSHAEQVERPGQGQRGAQRIGHVDRLSSECERVVGLTVLVADRRELVQRFGLLRPHVMCSSSDARVQSQSTGGDGIGGAL